MKFVNINIGVEMESIYYQFVNFWQDMKTSWFVTICTFLFALTLIFVAKFFKKYDGTQKEFVKLSYLILAILCFAILVYLTTIRK